MKPLSDEEIAGYQRAVAEAGGRDAVAALVPRVRDDLETGDITVTADELHAVAALVILGAHGVGVRQQ